MRLYYCKHCKNLLLTMNDVKVTPVCCGETMIELKANSVDAALEKHVPSVRIDGNSVDVVIGETVHPMLQEHYIEFILVETNKNTYIKYLKPLEEPKAHFILNQDEKVVVVYEYCNLHGLWKKEL